MPALMSCSAFRLGRRALILLVAAAAPLLLRAAPGALPPEIEAALADLKKPQLSPRDIIRHCFQRKAIDVGWLGDHYALDFADDGQVLDQPNAMTSGWAAPWGGLIRLPGCQVAASAMASFCSAGVSRAAMRSRFCW